METKSEKEEAKQLIAGMNAKSIVEEKNLDDTSVGSPDWELLKKRELEAIGAQRERDAAGGPNIIVQQTYRTKKFKFDKLNCGEARDVDSLRYVNHVAKPLLWPE